MVKIKVTSSQFNLTFTDGSNNKDSSPSLSSILDKMYRNKNQQCRLLHMLHPKKIPLILKYLNILLTMNNNKDLNMYNNMDYNDKYDMNILQIETVLDPSELLKTASAMFGPINDIIKLNINQISFIPNINIINKKRENTQIIGCIYLNTQNNKINRYKLIRYINEKIGNNARESFIEQETHSNQPFNVIIKSKVRIDPISPNYCDSLLIFHEKNSISLFIESLQLHSNLKIYNVHGNILIHNQFKLC